MLMSNMKPFVVLGSSVMLDELAEDYRINGGVVR